MDRVSIVNLLVGAGLPLLVAVVSKETWAGWVKGTILAALSAAGGLGTEYVSDPATFNLGVAGWSAATAFVFGVAAHYGIYKGTTLQELLAKALYKAPATADAEG
ncbi:hypothetical protein [Streptomyces sp. RTd22]|uniref:hypothetical protein n=1 Tax=Streptomyces sp. RTd22 TaxID=1841249 RepID=UPI0007C57AC6|nr:hypothetical protein [Streptomyces sp. RTd22]